MRQVMAPDGFFEDMNVPKLQFVPILISESGDYPYEANRYMVERSCGEWSADEDRFKDPVVQTLKSRNNMASRLCAFYYWCDQKKGRDWRTFDYQDDIICGYQADLLSGKGSASRRKLEPATVNLYVDEACSFLMWAAERGYRSPFRVPRRRVTARSSRGNHSRSHVPTQVTQRLGRLKSQPHDLYALPTNAEVERWLNDIGVRSPVKQLTFEFMLRTGARISEANQLTVHCFTRKDEWRDAWIHQQWIPVTLSYGVKGGKVTPASSRSTRSRTIELPLDLAERIEHYVAFSRPNLLARHHRGEHVRRTRTERMWLGEYTYQPMCNSTLYKAWKGSAYCPKFWHPHAAREFFAVERICQWTRDLLKSRAIDDPGTIDAGWLHGLMAGQVRLLLSPLLGHVDDRTTMLYLRGAQQRMIREFGHPSIRWNSIIDHG